MPRKPGKKYPLGPIYDDQGKQICGADRSQGRGPCRKRPVPGGNRCKFHGGESLKGSAHPNYKDGTYVEALPRELVGRFRAAEQDPKLTDLQADLALNRTLLLGHLQSMDSDESFKTLTRVRSLFSQLRKADRDKDNRDPFNDLMDQIGLTLMEATAKAANEQRIQNLMSDRVRLVESVNRRESELNQNIPVAEALIFARSVADIIQRMVTDRALRSSIMREIAALVDRPDAIAAGQVIDV